MSKTFLCGFHSLGLIAAPAYAIPNPGPMPQQQQRLLVRAEHHVVKHLLLVLLVLRPVEAGQAPEAIHLVHHQVAGPLRPATARRSQITSAGAETHPLHRKAVVAPNALPRPRIPHIKPLLRTQRQQVAVRRAGHISNMRP